LSVSNATLIRHPSSLVFNINDALWALSSGESASRDGNLYPPFSVSGRRRRTVNDTEHRIYRFR
jgi:hypothetical protein